MYILLRRLRLSTCYFVPLAGVLVLVMQIFASAMEIGFIVPLTPISKLGCEGQGAYELAAKLGTVSLIVPQVGGSFVDEKGSSRSLGEFDVLWWHQGDSSDLDRTMLDNDVLRQVREYVQSGGGLLLSGAAFALVNPLGIEIALPRRGGPGKDRVKAGLIPEPAYASHPAFKGLTTSGNAIWITDSGYPAFSDFYGTGGPKQGTLLAREYAGGGGENPLVEYKLGEGKIIALGWRLPHYSNVTNKFHPNLERLTSNIIRYLASRKLLLRQVYMVDISQLANAAPGRGKLNGEMAKSLSELTSGKLILLSVPFNIPSGKVGGKRFIVPNAAGVTIPISNKGSALMFLAGAVRLGSDGQPILRCTMVYADGKSTETTVRFGKEVGSIDAVSNLPDWWIAWQSKATPPAHLGIFELPNKRSDQTIQHILVRAVGNLPCVIAGISLAKSSPSPFARHRARVKAERRAAEERRRKLIASSRGIATPKVVFSKKLFHPSNATQETSIIPPTIEARLIALNIKERKCTLEITDRRNRQQCAAATFDLFGWRHLLTSAIAPGKTQIVHAKLSAESLEDYLPGEQMGQLHLGAEPTPFRGVGWGLPPEPLTPRSILLDLTKAYNSKLSAFHRLAPKSPQFQPPNTDRYLFSPSGILFLTAKRSSQKNIIVLASERPTLAPSGATFSIEPRRLAKIYLLTFNSVAVVRENSHGVRLIAHYDDGSERSRMLEIGRDLCSYFRDDATTAEQVPYGNITNADSEARSYAHVVDIALNPVRKVTSFEVQVVSPDITFGILGITLVEREM